MKKLIPFFTLVASFSSYSEEASSPTHFSVGMAVDQQLSVVVELDSQYRFTIGNTGAAFDYIIERGVFESDSPLSWYVGAGAWGEWEHDFGVRVPLGLSVELPKGWDMYSQVHPELNLYKSPELQIGAAVGIKYAF
ncbi:hypothetical protein ACP43V_10835 [Vibrio genomosp. F10 str. 9ZC157]|uniref:Outer membrane protein beta-barrel domain-containing protein n=1 Tax=Vibrio genomosp. F10 str. ZF-129 TaxID=1187848 RepID=A0A1E5BI53_9VIBR|nr:hypothetical protein [Vibrio genomosp. F10]OEE36982.1 hypothetical protein A1QO_04775 [Vibrio genomosp. F10 str. ZF-129]OEE94981.1 hypothetical protein A1QM_05610 [Vibrio genomosp. F10 str. 9ZC157]